MAHSGSFRILALTSDPTDATRLRLGQELRVIREYLRASEYGDRIELFERHAVRPSDIVQAFFEVVPNVVHFSGHGTAQGDLCFEDELGRVRQVDPLATRALFERFAGQVVCVVLNSCYSEVQAKAIVKEIKYVVGMNDAIGDDAAIHFAGGFYRALGAGQSIEDSVEFGRIELELHGKRSMAQHPVLLRNPALAPRHILMRPQTVELPGRPPEIYFQHVPGCARIDLDRKKEKEVVFVDPRAYSTFGELIDDIFVRYLSSRFSINSYGSEWVMEKVFDPWIAAPIEWAERAPCPLHELDDANWKYSTTLEEQFVTSSSWWRVLRMKPSHEFVGLAFKSERALGAMTWDKSLWALVHDLHQVRFRDIDISEYPYQFVVRNALLAGRSGIFAETTQLSEDVLSFIPPFRHE